MSDLKGDISPPTNPTLRAAISSLAKPLVGGLCALWLVALPLQAAETAAADEGTALQEVIVTGSRIPIPANITATSPIQTVSSQEITLQGHTDISDLTNALPQNFNNGNTDFGNHSNPLAASGGTATVDLRGLGATRTLVLVDGRRLGVGDSSTANPNPAPDLDQIPQSLVERVDVVTGGASAVYGSDAMAGVVNFIMKKNFEGVQVDGQYSVFEHNNHETGLENLEAGAGTTPPRGSVTDGGNRDLSLIVGTNTPEGSGNFTAYFTYHNQSAVPGGTRDFSDCEFDIATPTTNECGALNSSNANRFTVVRPLSAGGNSIRYTVVGNQFLPWPQAGSSPPATFNTFAFELLQREDERYNAGAMAHLDLADWAKPYLDVAFMDDKTTELVAPTAIFNGSNIYSGDGNYLINCSNPLLSAQEQGILCTPAQIAADKAVPGSSSADVQIGRRDIEGGSRIFSYEHLNYRVVGGMKGDFANAWSYDAYGQYYFTAAYTINPNQYGVSNVNNALQVTTNATTGQPVCISGGSCVPLNIFTSPGGLTPAADNYLYNPGTSYGTNLEEIWHADVTGDLGKYGIASPLAHDGLALNIGAEHRFEAVTFRPDETELTGQLEGTGGLLPISAAYSVKEAFIEVRAPIAQNLPFVHDLSIDSGYRYSDYSTSAGRTDTYKFEVQYAPIEDVRFRYSYDRAVRAPNLLDLFGPVVFGQQQVQGTDPCAPTLTSKGVVVPATATLAQCAHTGVTAAEYGNGGTTNSINQCTAGQCGEIVGGNTQLKPEIGDTYSVGLTFTPTILPAFNASVDYWHILLLDVINSIPANVIFNGCLNATNLGYCNDIKRTSAGSLSGATVANGGWISQTAVNTADEMVSGIDVQANYRQGLGAFGSLTTTFSGSWLQQWNNTPYVGAHTYDCAGLYGATCEYTVNPTWRHNMRVSWDSPWKTLVSVQWRYIGGSTFENNSNDPTLHFQELGFYDVHGRIPGYNYFDLTASWNVWKGFELRGGINNILDKDPPLGPSGSNVTQNLNIFPTYDLLGREMFVGFRAKF
jgi:iron complex outermembrane receptor protein